MLLQGFNSWAKDPFGSKSTKVTKGPVEVSWTWFSFRRVPIKDVSKRWSVLRFLETNTALVFDQTTTRDWHPLEAKNFIKHHKTHLEIPVTCCLKPNLVDWNLWQCSRSRIRIEMKAGLDAPKWIVAPWGGKCMSEQWWKHAERECPRRVVHGSYEILRIQSAVRPLHRCRTAGRCLPPWQRRTSKAKAAVSW